jgi:hypothetical protein
MAGVLLEWEFSRRRGLGTTAKLEAGVGGLMLKKKSNSPQSSQRAQRGRIERLAAFSVDSANSVVNLF